MEELGTVLPEARALEREKIRFGWLKPRFYKISGFINPGSPFVALKFAPF
jgi:hypothetical protein